MPEGYSLGGRHIHDYLVEMTDKDVPPAPPIKNNDEEQGGRDGGWDFGVQYLPKIITVDHYILAETKQERKDMIRSLAGITNPRKGSQELIFDDEPDKMYFARLNEQFALDKEVSSYSDFTLIYICYDPFTYSTEEYTRNISGSGTIDHEGTHVSRPVLVIDHNGGAATITNTEPSGRKQEVIFKSSTAPGQYTIDMKEGIILRGNESGEKHIDSVQWFEMPEGTNTITHSNNISGITVIYRHTWL
ncbi:hypothetical protein BpsM61_00061 [Bacillus phage vB_BpsM-61]|nr:hypothetical protein BpsM61_00061 [Bacillus phage vB_BpsM-61]